jgi:mannose-6-phosphate isomerase-like protein (cupin superfamily)
MTRRKIFDRQPAQPEFSEIHLNPAGKHRRQPAAISTRRDLALTLVLSDLNGRADDWRNATLHLRAMVRGAPTHLHAVEEVLTVLEGQAEIWIENEREAVSAGQSVIVAAGRHHGFRNTSLATLHVQSMLAAPIFEASYHDRNEISRRWVPIATSSSA